MYDNCWGKRPTWRRLFSQFGLIADPGKKERRKESSFMHATLLCAFVSHQETFYIDRDDSNIFAMIN